jgi:hypothetical protein
MRSAILAAGLAVGLCGCGSDVEVFELPDDGVEVVDPVEIGGSHQWGNGTGQSSRCVACDVGDCGLCFGMYGATHRCTGELPPGTGCFQLGSLFDDGGEHYVCWSCD